MCDKSFPLSSAFGFCFVSPNKIQNFASHPDSSNSARLSFFVSRFNNPWKSHVCKVNRHVLSKSKTQTST